jgi:hypothetical protein
VQSQTGNWSCILHDDTVIIHAEDCDHAAQHLYPLSIIKQHLQQIPTLTGPETRSKAQQQKLKPQITAILPPPRSIRRRFLFPDTPPDESDMSPSTGAHPSAPLYGQDPPSPEEATQAGDPANPFRWPEWYVPHISHLHSRLTTRSRYPDSCHFVRQWWPATPATELRQSISRRVSCTVVLLARHDRETHHNSYVLAQHYFGTPLSALFTDEALPPPELEPASRRPGPSNSRSDGSVSAPAPRKPTRVPQLMEGVPLRMWYVSAPFDIVCVADRSVPDDLDEDDFMRERPLLAVDFGHAVWIEWHTPSAEERARDAEYAQLLAIVTDTDGDGDEALSTRMSASVPIPEAAEDAPHDRRHVMKRRLMFSTFPAVEIDALGRELNPGRSSEAVVRRLEVPEELDLGQVETINIDQSQGAIFMSVKDGQIFVVYYE